MWSVDIYVEVDGRKFAVEVDGPQHYTQKGKLLGSYVVRDKCMEEEDLVNIRVPHFTWDGLNDAQRTVKLQRLFQSTAGGAL